MFVSMGKFLLLVTILACAGLRHCSIAGRAESLVQDSFLVASLGGYGHEKQERHREHADDGCRCSNLQDISDHESENGTNDCNDDSVNHHLVDVIRELERRSGWRDD